MSLPNMTGCGGGASSTTFRKYVPKKEKLLEQRFTNYVALSGYIYMIHAPA